MTTKKPARAAKPTPKKPITLPRPSPSRRIAALAPPATKASIILKLLGRPAGASTTDLATATDWQPHSVRGFISGTLKKKRGLSILADRSTGETRYRIATGKA